jgi:diadenosine tetraphosphatase ApaH/serine/threonine PP2A family protein phosphatase
MLSTLFRRREKMVAVAPRVPPETRVYAIGDIHGRVDLLRDVHQMIHEDAYAHQAPRNVVVYVGDYIDRGPYSSEVVDLLLDEPLPGFERVHLMGNHEDSLLRFLEDIEIASSWLAYGGAATLQSYGVRPPRGGKEDEIRRTQEALARNLPEAHLRFYRGLAMCHVEGDYFFVHAGVKPGVPLDGQSREDLMWIRDPFLHSDADHGKIVVHGHTISEAPDVRRNRIGIDTGAFASGRLTCLVLAGDRWSFLQTARR